MPRYIDGYVLPVPKKNLPAYRRMASLAGKVWRECGALDYVECAAEDFVKGCGTPFDKLLRLSPRETAVFSYVVFKSRAHRDRVNARVMKDPRIQAMADPKKCPFDMKRMAYAGFKAIVEA